MNMIDTIRESQTRSLEQIRTSQEQIVEFNERIADTMLGAMPEWQSPFSEYLPKPADMVSTYWDFVSELQKANAEFSMRLVKAWDNGSEDQVATPAAEKATPADAEKTAKAKA